MTYSILGIDTQTHVRVDIPQSSRRQGLYIIGGTGQGKTGLIENLIVQDIKQGLGVGLLDPHGDLTNAVLSRLPQEREQDVILLDIANKNTPFGLNLFTCNDATDPLEVSRAKNKVMHVFKKLWGKGGVVVEDAWGVLLEEILGNATSTFLEASQYSTLTMAEIPLLLEEDVFRNQLAAKLTNRHVKNYWLKKYNRLSEKDQREERRSTLNRVNAFLTQPLVENIVGQAHTTIDFRAVMDERKILLVKLDNRLEDVTSLIGSMIIAELLNAAYSRADLPVNKRRQFNLYADEFQRFATEDFATILTEARKFGIATTIAHQMRSQLDTQNRGATLNVANLVVFKISGTDAQELAGEFNIIPPPAETRREVVLAPVADPLGFLLEKGSHPDERVNAVVRQLTEAQKPLPILTTLFARANTGVPLRELLKTDGEQQAFLASWRNRLAQLYWEQRRQSGINAFLLNFHPYFYASSYADAMAEEFGLFGQVVAWTEKSFPFKAFEYPTQPDRFSVFKPGERRLSLAQQEQINQVRETGDRLLLQLFTQAANPQGNAFQAAARSFAALVRPLYLNWYRSLKWQIRGLVENHIQRNSMHTDAELWLTTLQPYFPWLIRTAQVPLWEWGTIVTRFGRRGEPVERVRQDWVNECALSVDWEEVERRLSQEVDEAIAEEKTFVEQFLSDFASALTTLARDPIMGSAGKYEEKPLAPRTYADMQNEVAATLVNLPTFTARVRITTEAGLVEHTIKTLEPERGMGRAALQERIERIQAQNRNEVYIRSRQAVEEEIRFRQDKWLKMAQLPQTQASPQLSKPEDEAPAISRRETI